MLVEHAQVVELDVRADAADRVVGGAAARPPCASRRRGCPRRACRARARAGRSPWSWGISRRGSSTSQSTARPLLEPRLDLVGRLLARIIERVLLRRAREQPAQQREVVGRADARARSRAGGRRSTSQRRRRRRGGRRRGGSRRRPSRAPPSTSVRQERRNSRVAASALTVTRERQTAARAGRLRLIDHSSGGESSARAPGRRADRAPRRRAAPRSGPAVARPRRRPLRRARGDAPTRSGPTSPTNHTSAPGSSSPTARLPCSRIGFLSPLTISSRRSSSTAATSVAPAGQRYSRHHCESGSAPLTISSKVSRAAT